MLHKVVETKSIYHFAPGAITLSLNPMNQSSDFRFTAEEVIQHALEKKIKILAWTGNESITWNKFISSTARLAKKSGLINLYKSSRMASESLGKLNDVIDLFSLTPESKNEISQIYKYQKHHLEIHSRIENVDDTHKISEWILTHLDASVPLHLDHDANTSPATLKQARHFAKSLGVEHCYLKNFFGPGEWLNTTCSDCDAILVSRSEGRTVVDGVSASGFCENCGEPTPISGIQYIPRDEVLLETTTKRRLPNRLQHLWCGEINAGHVTVVNKSNALQELIYCHLGNPKSQRLKLELKPREQYRFLLARPNFESKGFEIKANDCVDVYFLETLEPAHF